MHLFIYFNIEVFFKELADKISEKKSAHGILDPLPILHEFALGKFLHETMPWRLSVTLILCIYCNYFLF
jgi:hypothetical protein